MLPAASDFVKSPSTETVVYFDMFSGSFPFLKSCTSFGLLKTTGDLASNLQMHDIYGSIL